MMKIRFIKDGSEGKTSKWRYKNGEEVLLPDYLANEAIADELAIQINDRPIRQNVVSPAAHEALERAKRENK